MARRKETPTEPPSRETLQGAMPQECHEAFIPGSEPLCPIWCVFIEHRQCASPCARHRRDAEKGVATSNSLGPSLILKRVGLDALLLGPRRGVERLVEAWGLLAQDHPAGRCQAEKLSRKHLAAGPVPKTISVPEGTEEPGSLLPALQAALYPQSRRRPRWQASPNGNGGALSLRGGAALLAQGAGPGPAAPAGRGEALGSKPSWPVPPKD